MKEKIVKPEKNCPHCGGRIQWKTVIGKFGQPLYQGHCSPCAIVFRGREHPNLAKGKKLAENLIGVGCMDKKITKLNYIVQIGILRSKQHCKTCGNPSYPIRSEEDNCNCVNCVCVFCKEKIYKGKRYELHTKE